MLLGNLEKVKGDPEQPKKSQGCEFLADPGAVYSVVPQSILKRLGVKPTSSQEFILANGEIVKKPVGNAYFEYPGKVRVARSSSEMKTRSCWAPQR